MIYTMIAASAMVCLTILTILNQLGSSRWNIIRQRDTFNLIPIWTFFAPRPGQTDYHLLYRLRDAAGLESAWVEIPLAEERTLWSWIWNPEKRSKKVLSDIVASLIQSGVMQCERDTDYLLTMPYLLLLRVVCTHVSAHHPTADVVQFVLAETRGLARNETPNLLLMSRFHSLGHADSVTQNSLPSHV